MTNIDIKYYEQYIDTFGDIDITFDSMKDCNILYKGKFKDGITLHAILTYYDYDTIEGFEIVSGEKIKVYDFSPDKIRLVKNDIVLHEFMVCDLHWLNVRKGIAFGDDKDGFAVIKVTWDDDSIFALKHETKSPYFLIRNRFPDIVKSLESELEKEILKGNGDRHKIATYDRRNSEMLHHNNLHALAINADVQTALFK
nr:hypothetical protein [uncultured Mediterranean phage uvMED]